MDSFKEKLDQLKSKSEEFLSQKNEVDTNYYNGIYDRYIHPVITTDHIPVHWRFDLDPKTNPYLMERIGVNATMNSGAIKHDGKYRLVVRTEGWDRKSYFTLAESPNGVDNFRFIGKPIEIPQLEDWDTNVYDMRFIEHEDGFIYGIFCTERKDQSAPEGDTSTAVANAGIVRTKDYKTWERLPDLVSNTGQQRNVVLHPDFVNGKYAIYTRPQDGFISVGNGGGIGLGYVDDMTNPVVKDETIINNKVYHTVYELKNGLGPAPIKTAEGWLHLAHGVRNTAAGLRYVLYMFMTDLKDISKIIYQPGGYFIAPMGEERVGDVSNVAFSNGWIADDDGKVFIYYASADTRMHVAVTSIDQLIDYVKNTPKDDLYSHKSVDKICDLIDKNNKLS
jgi:4-O-beta-D-mannosyl-D-glucose phosphorylase